MSITDLKTKPAIVFDEEILEAIYKLAEERPNEWYLCAKTEKISPTEFKIVDFCVPYQENSKSSTKIPTKATHKDFEEEFDPTFEWISRDGDIKDPKTWKKYSKWNCLIHSHNTMGVFWSEIDQQEMKELAKDRPSTFITLVVNAKKEMLAFVAMPEIGFEFDECPIQYYPANIPDITGFIKMTPEEQEEVKKKIERRDNLFERLNEEITAREIEKKLPAPKTYSTKYDNYKHWNYGTTKSYGRNSLKIDDDIELNEIIIGYNDEEYIEISQKVYDDGAGYYISDMSTGKIISKANIKKILNKNFLEELLKQDRCIIYIEWDDIYGETICSTYWRDSWGEDTPNKILNYFPFNYNPFKDEKYLLDETDGISYV